ncbi:MAG: hypothetical protein DID90_2727553896 [Candidatus Nitrotoga sp. LAW]|nr:MAG: hypothetical protein DID90_2727553896 [Candidatus Nitrotoga sp. LAW]
MDRQAGAAIGKDKAMAHRPQREMRVASRNAYKGGERAVLRIMAALLHEQRDGLKRVYSMYCRVEYEGAGKISTTLREPRPLAFPRREFFPLYK